MPSVCVTDNCQDKKKLLNCIRDIFVKQESITSYFKKSTNRGNALNLAHSLYNIYNYMYVHTYNQHRYIAWRRSLAGIYYLNYLNYHGSCTFSCTKAKSDTDNWKLRTKWRKKRVEREAFVFAVRRLGWIHKFVERVFVNSFIFINSYQFREKGVDINNRARARYIKETFRGPQLFFFLSWNCPLFPRKETMCVISCFSSLVRARGRRFRENYRRRIGRSIT